MTRVQTILEEISRLSPEEMESVYITLRKQMDRLQRIKLALRNYVGQASGFWHEDAQEYVNQLREERENG
jgi:hypothetical protein